MQHLIALPPSLGDTTLALIAKAGRLCTPSASCACRTTACPPPPWLLRGLPALSNTSTQFLCLEEGLPGSRPGPVPTSSHGSPASQDQDPRPRPSASGSSLSPAGLQTSPGTACRAHTTASFPNTRYLDPCHPFQALTQSRAPHQLRHKGSPGHSSGDKLLPTPVWTS